MRTFVIAALTLALMSEASAEERRIAGFDSVMVSGNFEARVITAESFSVRVEGPDAHLIRTRLDSDTLKIEPARRSWFGSPQYDASVVVTLPHLTSVAAARGAEVTASASGDCASFDAVAAMGAQLSVRDLNCDSVDATAAMGGQLTLNGACERVNAAAAMGGAVRADGLQCRIADASAAMGGSVQAFASESYNASAAMGGNIGLAGAPASGERSAVMGGSVRVGN